MNDWLFNPLRLGRGRTEEATTRAAEGPTRLTLGRQGALYATLVLGNFASSFLEAYRASQAWHPSILALLFGLVVGLVLLPGAIDANKMNGEREELVQFAMVFTYGIGWQTLLGAAIQAAAGG
jgi:hypothetical protein